MSLRKIIPPSSVAFLLLATTAATAAAEGGIGRFQHGGRATAQAGAMTARADEPSAVTYNPAGITRLGGLQLEAGLDFSNPTDEYASDAGSFSANHTIQFPPALYLTWRPQGPGRFAFGLGVDSPAWYRVEWNPALFPGRFLTRVAEARFLEVHPVVAYEIDERWSVGGGLRYLAGSLEEGFNRSSIVTFADAQGVPTSPPIAVELETLAEADVDALSFDLGVQYGGNVWGWGAVYRHGADFEESGTLGVSVRDISHPDYREDILSLYRGAATTQRFELPWEVSTGLWLAPYPELVFELDAAFRAWSVLDRPTLTVDPGALVSIAPPTRRDWDDTLSLRLGVEGEITEAWSLSGGVAYEPTPVPEEGIEPGFPRGDATVYAVGFSYNLPRISFDAGYSLHDFDDHTARGQEQLTTATSTYGADEQVWSLSARWRF